MKPYARSCTRFPISKSNFKLHNKDGRAILITLERLMTNMPYMRKRLLIMLKSKSYYHTRRIINCILKVYYKSEKRHPDTANITKSIFDGIEKRTYS